MLIAYDIHKTYRKHRMSLPVLTAMGMATLTACNGEASPPAAAEAMPPRPVQVAEVRLSSGESSAAHTGVVRARREVELGFRTGGRIVSRAVEVGQAVTASPWSDANWPGQRPGSSTIALTSRPMSRSSACTRIMSASASRIERCDLARRMIAV